jgi:hypothetical protein
MNKNYFKLQEALKSWEVNMEKEKLTWEEIESFLKKELGRTKYILTFGTIGSHNIEHDIDTIITKKPSSKTSDFYKEVHYLLDSLNQWIKINYNKKLVRFSMFSHQEEVLKIGNYKKGDLALHLMTYISLSQIEDHWKPDLERGESVKELLRKGYNLIFGSIDFLFEGEFSKPTNNNSKYIRMNDLDRIHSNYAESFLVKSMNHLFKYVLKNKAVDKNLIAKNKIEVRKYFYELCDILDKLNKEKI